MRRPRPAHARPWVQLPGRGQGLSKRATLEKRARPNAVSSKVTVKAEKLRCERGSELAMPCPTSMRATALAAMVLQPSAAIPPHRSCKRLRFSESTEAKTSAKAQEGVREEPDASRPVVT